jgi:hypothetical protein
MKKAINRNRVEERERESWGKSFEFLHTINI